MRGILVFYVISLIAPIVQAAEKSLSLLRSSPDQVTANLASGTFSSFALIRNMRWREAGVHAHCISIINIVVAPVVRLLRCKAISL